jgi:TonB family protein
LNSHTDRTPPAIPARLAALTLFLATTLAVAAAQTSSTFSGTVIDPQGAVLPGVDVTLTAEGQQTPQRVSTTRSGQFQFTGLAPGEYAVRVQVPGFRSYSGQVSVAAANVVQTIALQVGEVHETIHVVDAGESGTATTQVAAAPPIPACGQQPATGDVRIGGNIRPPMKFKHVSPIYPASLRGTGVDGEVVLDGVIGADGLVHDMRAREGSRQEFVDAFVTAVTQWQFTPTLLNCLPIEVPITITGRFSAER